MEKRVFEIQLADMEWSSEAGSASPRVAETYPSFGLVVQEGNNLISKTATMYCRESLCECVRQDVRGLSVLGIDRRKTKLIVKRRVAWGNKKRLEINKVALRQQVEAGKLIANAIEKRNGWPLTRVYSTRITKHQSDIRANVVYYYIVGNVRWIKSPAMLSLFTLFWRIGYSNNRYKFTEKIHDYTSMIAALRDFGLRSRSIEARYVSTYLDSWLTILENYNYLFKGRKIEDLYDPKGKNPYLFSEGINSLCDLDTADDDLRVRYWKLIGGEE